MIFVSIGCPSGIGPEVAVRAADTRSDRPIVLVGDEDTISAACDTTQVDRAILDVYDPGPRLGKRDRIPGRPSRRSGEAQLAWIDAAYRAASATPGSAIVTGPVNKAAIARSGAPRARSFTGHTEHLAALDRAKSVTMCFWSEGLATSLVTTHLPISRVARALSATRVSDAIVSLATLVLALRGKRRKKPPVLAVTSLNPHAGEDELFGGEEARAIAPGIRSAQRRLGSAAEIVGPIGAETAYRKAALGTYAGVVAMFHDQATIPMKLLAFGNAVNVTMGLSVVRTSVDHGTAYDIAWQRRADPRGMGAAIDVAEALLKVDRTRR